MALAGLESLHDLDGRRLDLLAGLGADGLARAQHHGRILITAMSHVALDPSSIVVGHAEHLQGGMQVLLVDLGQVVAI